MSRAFAKDDGPDEPPVVAPRAPLPGGVANYVTPRGLALLRAERDSLASARAAADADHADEAERSRRLSILAQQQAMLNERIAQARVVTPAPSPTVRFGATVTYRAATGTEERTVTLVGVDEADAAAGLVAFTAPVARALIGKTAGDTATLQTAGAGETLTVVAVRYDG